MLSFMEGLSFWALGTEKTSLCDSWYHWAVRASRHVPCLLWSSSHTLCEPEDLNN